ncbi:MAG: DUF6159 family protein [Verrucomicrobiota bacterium]|jgi:hypothetical protein
MITKFKQSWELFKASITVTLRHRKLLWFPVLTTILTGFIALFFLSAMALPVALHHTGYHLNQKQHWLALKDYYLPAPAVQPKPRDPAAVPAEALNILLTGHSAAADTSGHSVAARGLPWGTVCLLAIYFVSMFLATFFNVAFYSEIIAALNGKGVSFRRGLITARSRLTSILAWSLLAGLVGWIIRSIEQRLPFAARIVTGLIGLAWSIAAVFAIPVIIQEQPMRNPIKILRQSAMTLKRTWGEGLIGYVGFSAGNAVIFGISLFPLLLAGALALLFKSVWVMAIAGVVWFLGLLFIGYVSGVAGNVYRCALYLYASEGVVPEPFNQDLLDMAWKVKQNSAKQ